MLQNVLGVVHVTPISLATIRALERALEAEFEACGKTWEGVEVWFESPGKTRETRETRETWEPLLLHERARV